MLNKNFYPTPIEVIEMMVGNFDLKNKKILDPSAGNGNILNYISNKFDCKTFAVEIEDDFRKILENSNHKVIGCDFLKINKEDISHIDYIFMNPPFDGDEKHILRAFDNAPDGCTIVALCNTQTMENKYSYYRESLKYYSQRYGYTKDLGSVFKNAERPTEVEITMIVLFKPQTSNFEEFFEMGNFDMSEDDRNSDEGIIKYDFIYDVVNRYVGIVKEYQKMQHHAINISNLCNISKEDKVSLNNKVIFSINQSESTSNFEDVLVELRKNFWDFIFKKLNLEKYNTSKLKEMTNKFFETQKQFPFTMKNIYQMIYIIVGTHKGRMEMALKEAIDKVIDLSDDNKISFEKEKWKTNSHKMIGEKFIVDYICRKGYNGQIDYLYGGNRLDLVNDLLKVMDYYFPKSQKSEQFCHSYFRTMQFGKWYITPHFEIKFFQKGTCHFKFTNKKDWQTLNIMFNEICGNPLPQWVF